MQSGLDRTVRSTPSSSSRQASKRSARPQRQIASGSSKMERPPCRLCVDYEFSVALASLLLFRMVGAVVHVVLFRFRLGFYFSHAAHALHHSLHHVLHHGALALLHLFDVSADLRTKLGQLCRILGSERELGSVFYSFVLHGSRHHLALHHCRTCL